MIGLDAVTKSYPGEDRPAVDRLTIQVEEGEIVALVGPSGCGKTTTLKMINRLIEPTSGIITVGGRDITSMPPPQLRRSIGYVIQQAGLFPHRTVFQNIATVPRLLGWDRTRIRARIDELLDLVDLGPGMGDRYPNELSGGQQQRVGVARALAADPPVILMDEPFGAVDPIVRARLQGELLRMQSRLHKTIVLVTHDIDEAIRLGDRVAILAPGGRLAQFATPEQILRDPEAGFVEGFLGPDRGLRRLSLIPLRNVELVEGPVVELGSGRGEALDAMTRHGLDWVVVRAGDRLLGWASAAEIDAGARLEAGSLQPIRGGASIDGSLRDALDTMVTGHTGVALVFDGDRYLGMITIDAVNREMLR